MHESGMEDDSVEAYINRIGVVGINPFGVATPRKHVHHPLVAMRIVSACICRTGICIRHIVLFHGFLMCYSMNAFSLFLSDRSRLS